MKDTQTPMGLNIFQCQGVWLIGCHGSTTRSAKPSWSIHDPRSSGGRYIYTPESTHIDPDLLAPERKIVFLYQPVVFRVHVVVCQGVSQAISP